MVPNFSMVSSFSPLRLPPRVARSLVSTFLFSIVRRDGRSVSRQTLQSVSHVQTDRELWFLSSCSCLIFGCPLVDRRVIWEILDSRCCLSRIMLVVLYWFSFVSRASRVIRLICHSARQGSPTQLSVPLIGLVDKFVLLEEDEACDEQQRYYRVKLFVVHNDC